MLTLKSKLLTDGLGLSFPFQLPRNSLPRCCCGQQGPRRHRRLRPTWRARRSRYLASCVAGVLARETGRLAGQDDELETPRLRQFLPLQCSRVAMVDHREEELGTAETGRGACYQEDYYYHCGEWFGSIRSKTW